MNPPSPMAVLTAARSRIPTGRYRRDDRPAASGRPTEHARPWSLAACLPWLLRSGSSDGVGGRS